MSSVQKSTRVFRKVMTFQREWGGLCFSGKGESQIAEGLIFIEHIFRYFARVFLIQFSCTSAT